MRLRNLLLFLLLGTFVAVLPAMASSETTPKVEAVSTGQSGGIYSHETFAWSPMQATIGRPVRAFQRRIVLSALPETMTGAPSTTPQTTDLTESLCASSGSPTAAGSITLGSTL